MSLYSPNEIQHAPPRFEPAPPLTPLRVAQAHAAFETGPEAHDEQPGRRLPRWPLLAIAVAAVITLMWNALLIWALIGAFFD